MVGACIPNSATLLPCTLCFLQKSNGKFAH